MCSIFEKYHPKIQSSGRTGRWPQSPRSRHTPRYDPAAATPPCVQMKSIIRRCKSIGKTGRWPQSSRGWRTPWYDRQQQHPRDVHSDARANEPPSLGRASVMWTDDKSSLASSAGCGQNARASPPPKGHVRISEWIHGASVRRSGYDGFTEGRFHRATVSPSDGFTRSRQSRQRRRGRPSRRSVECGAPSARRSGGRLPPCACTSSCATPGRPIATLRNKARQQGGQRKGEGKGVRGDIRPVS